MQKMIIGDVRKVKPLPQNTLFKCNVLEQRRVLL